MKEDVHANDKEIKSNQERGQDGKDLTEPDEREMDILDLPPRKEVHGGSKSRIRLKVSLPLFRLIVVILLILGLSAGLYWAGNEGLLGSLSHAFTFSAS
ncbi:hypothetical protein ACFOGI_01630 [Virgibacillus xinjiangensis]|uniref:Uncharacterized protein n=1 Tax=Virgibacillus xinjiangensis TaxID=393090 RepID=A0ABV7CRL2_9BACI